MIVELSFPQPPGLLWLLRLRWIACLGILLVCGLGVWFYGIRLPWGVIGGVVAAVAASNLLARRMVGKPGVDPARILVFGDVLLLTILLYFTGGAHNPFTVLYLLHITLAVILLDGLAAWCAVVLCGGCFALLFSSSHMLIGSSGQALCDDLDFHLRGMLAATVVAGAGVVYFVTHIGAAARAHREIAERSREVLEREQRFVSVATLAAGLAHELATPLGTIALASKELENEARETCGNPSCLADVRLIRQEVDRCRTILERIGNEAVRTPEEGASLTPPHRIREGLPAYLPGGFIDRVRWQIGPDLPPIAGSESCVLRSLAVLVKNACEAAPLKPVDVHVFACGDTVNIEVSDQGPGMSREILARLGEPFFTTKAPGVGMGLGFFLVRALAENLRGSVDVESRVGAGTRVTLSLPASS